MENPVHVPTPLPRTEMEDDDRVRVVHGGFWNRNVYMKGEEELVFTSLRSLTYQGFLEIVHKVVLCDRRLYDYKLHCLMPAGDGREIRSLIICSRDLKRVAGISEVPKVFVTLQPKNAATNQFAVGQSGLMNHIAVPNEPFYPPGFNARFPHVIPYNANYWMNYTHYPPHAGFPPPTNPQKAAQPETQQMRPVEKLPRNPQQSGRPETQQTSLLLKPPTKPQMVGQPQTQQMQSVEKSSANLQQTAQPITQQVWPIVKTETNPEQAIPPESQQTCLVAKPPAKLQQPAKPKTQQMHPAVKPLADLQQAGWTKTKQVRPIVKPPTNLQQGGRPNTKKMRVTVSPPTSPRPVTPPKSHRVPSHSFTRRACSRCHQEGHNRATCHVPAPI